MVDIGREAIQGQPEEDSQGGCREGRGVVIAGHTRLKAAESLGLEEVPVVVAEGLSPEKAKAYRLADNKTAEASSWDESLLGKELDEISLLDLDFSMEDFGFGDMESLLPDGKEAYDDDFDATPPDETDICEGDMFRLGEHVLLCGDSSKSETVRKLMGGGR